MTRDETIELFEACQAAEAEVWHSTKDPDAAHAEAVHLWNDWAERLLARKKELQQGNKWAVRTNGSDLAGENQATVDWLEAAHVNFSGYQFKNNADFRNFIFPGPTSFSAVPPVIGDIIDERDRNLIFLRRKGQFLSGMHFPDYDVQFSRGALFRNTEFLGPTNFNGARFLAGADFNGAIFNDDATFVKSLFLTWGGEFDNARFMKSAYFSDAKFEKQSEGTEYIRFAEFYKTKFDGDAYFIRTKFNGPACFVGAEFSKRANFDHAKFIERVNFNTTQFGGDAWFRDFGIRERIVRRRQIYGAFHFDGSVRFAGDADFLQARFEGYTTFRNAHFNGKALFRGVSVDRVFDLDGVCFSILPDFHAAHFAEAPRLDNLVLPSLRKSLGTGLAWRILKAGGISTIIHSIKVIIRLIKRGGGPLLRPGDYTAHLRALRRLAIQGHDYENERRFLKEEILARRFVLDKRWGFAFLLGVGYDGLSDFGISLVRPIYWWLAFAVIFALLYYFLAFPGTCGGNSSQTLLKALYLSFQKELLLISWDSDMEVSKVTDCLKEARDVNFFGAFALGLIQFFQKLLSATLWFLLLLAIRNRFKLK